MSAVLSFITWVVATLPTITQDVGVVISMVQGARAALTDLQSANPQGPQADQVAQLDAQVAALEATWQAELASARAAQQPDA